MPNNYCQTFKQKIEKLKGKIKNIEALLSEYKNTGNEEIAQELDTILKEIEKFKKEFKKEFKNKATQLIKEFIQRRENKNERIEIVFDETDFRFIINGSPSFTNRTHFNDFPNLIKEITGFLDVRKVKTLDLPKLKKVYTIYAINAKTINLPNLEEAEYIHAEEVKILDLPKLKRVSDIYAMNAQVLNLPKLKEAASIYANNAKTINLPNLEEVFEIYAYQAQTINLPKIRELENIYFYENNPNLESLLNQAREWRTRGILKGKIKIKDKKYITLDREL